MVRCCHGHQRRGLPAFYHFLSAIVSSHIFSVQYFSIPMTPTGDRDTSEPIDMPRLGLLALLEIRLSIAYSSRIRKTQSSPTARRATSHRPANALWHLQRWPSAQLHTDYVSPLQRALVPHECICLHSGSVNSNTSDGRGHCLHRSKSKAASSWFCLTVAPSTSKVCELHGIFLDEDLQLIA